MNSYFFRRDRSRHRRHRYDKYDRRHDRYDRRDRYDRYDRYRSRSRSREAGGEVWITVGLQLGPR